MNRLINNQELMLQLFDDKIVSERAADIWDAILAPRLNRLTDVVVEMKFSWI